MRAPLSVESIEKELQKEPWMGTYWKTSQTNKGDWEGKPGDYWEHLSPIRKLMSLKKPYCWWKTSQPDDGKTEEENRIRDQSMKNLLTNEEDYKRKPKNHDKKTFQPGLKTGKEKRDWWREEGFVQGGTWMMRDSARIRCCVVFQKSNCQ